MTLYTIHAPPERNGEGEADPMALVFIKEGFSWPALLFPAIWLIVQRMWLVLVVYLAVAIGLVVATEQLDDVIAWTILILYRCLFALEANGLRRWTCEGRGWRPIGVSEGRNQDEAEIRFFADWPAWLERASPAPAKAPPPTAAARVTEPWKPTPENGGVVGLFPTPGTRP